MSMQQNFINLIKDGAIKGWEEYKILPSLTIAQAILETGWGRSSIGNNLFGIKARDDWKGKKKLVRTHEYVNGKKIYINAYFRDYDSIYESLEDRYKFLQKPRYSKVIGVKEYKKACHEIWKAGYATDPKYPDKLIRIIEQYKLHQYDKQAMEKPKQSLFKVQVGAFSNIDNATRMADRLKKDGYNAYVPFANGLYRVQVGAFSVRDNADKLANELKSKNYRVFVAEEVK